MGLKKFIGARYAPEFAGEWSNTKQYAALSVVYADNRSYVSRKTVPAGTAISNTEFWIQSSDWNAQVAEYNLKVEGYNANAEQYNKNVENYAAAVSGFYADTLHSFDTKADMQADKTLALGETLLTCGDKKIGDGGGSFYQVVAQTSVTAVALDNGLFAEPFEFQPYDYSQFQQEVEGYKNSTTRVYNVQADMVADEGINAGNVLMTTGAVEMGDGQGAFWNVSNEQSTGAVALNNGKYAKKFNLTSVDVSGNLLFNNKGNQVAIWGIKAGGEAVNVPVTYAVGETRTVFAAVEYTPDNTNATVNLVVNGPSNFTKTFAWSDTSVPDGQVKTVMYAITLHSSGNNVYTGAQTVTSYLTTLDKFIQTFNVNVPDAANATAVWNGANVRSIEIVFTVNSPVILNSFTTYTKSSKEGNMRIRLLEGAESANTNNYITVAYPDITTTSSYKKFSPNLMLIPDRTYRLHLNAVATIPLGVTYITPPATTVSGTYGAFTFNEQAYAGAMTYTSTTLGNEQTITETGTSVTKPDGRQTSTFTVNQAICITEITFNVTGKYAIDIQRQGYYPELTLADTSVSKTSTMNYILRPGNTYVIGWATSETAYPGALTKTSGPFEFNDTHFAGTIKYKIIQE